MTETIQREGHCLCGQVEIQVKTMSFHVGACHCDMCRRWGGGPFMEVNCGSDVNFSPLALIKTFSSSDWAERGFCVDCGTHLFYRLKETQEHMIPVGLFNSSEPFVFDRQVFIDEKPSFYHFENKTELQSAIHEVHCRRSNKAGHKLVDGAMIQRKRITHLFNPAVI